MQLPIDVKSGEAARLFPVVSDSSKEQRATSILLSVISAVPALAEAVLSQLDVRISTRTVTNTYTEVVFKKDNDSSSRSRPDGLIEVSTGSRTWTSLVESKIGKNFLEKDQVERYLRLARDNSIDAVITISNEFAAFPTHHPILVSKTLTRSVSLYHLSWTSILTSAILLQDQAAATNPEQAFLLRELVRFFSPPSDTVIGFTSMPKEWTLGLEKLKAGGNIPKGDLRTAIVGAWHQEIRDLSLQMSQRLSRRVTVVLLRRHTKSAEERVKADSEFLANIGELKAVLRIPNAAADLTVVADLNRRAIRVKMEIHAPRDKKSAKARISWLLRQLKSAEADGIHIGLVWASKTATSYHSLAALRENSAEIVSGYNHVDIRAFEVTMTSDGTKGFTGRRTFIDELERLVPVYYEAVGQCLRSWKPDPPKPKYSVKEIESGDAPGVERFQSPGDSSGGLPGNAHSELLEIPSFLIRSVR